VPRRELVDVVRRSRVDLLGVPLDCIETSQVVSILLGLAKNPGEGLTIINTVNPEFITLAIADRDFRRCLGDPDSVNVIDGIGVALGVRLIHGIRAERTPGSRLIFSVIDVANRIGSRVFLLGSNDRVLGRMRKRIASVFPKLSMRSYAPPLLDFERLKGHENDRILARIQAFGPTFLLVALGTPKQEKWLDWNRRRLASMGVACAMGVGGAFDYVAGTCRPPSSLVRSVGLEWLYRLLREPRRFRRQVYLIRFLGMLFRAAWASWTRRVVR
jgi:N-acetylglucosaminyldiphosphoundecaprenol N-acetyl-beta-D-mannosaminyltransferase